MREEGKERREGWKEGEEGEEGKERTIGEGREGGREILGVPTLLSYQTKWSPYSRQN